MKKMIGLALLGLIVGGLLFAGYKFFFSEPPLHSPLPKEEGINIIYISPTTTP